VGKCLPITIYDNESLNNVCVLGFSAFKDLYSGEDILGKNIYVSPNKIPLRVIGILNEKGFSFSLWNNVYFFFYKHQYRFDFGIFSGKKAASISPA